MTKTVRVDQVFYSKYCSNSTSIQNGQFIISAVTETVPEPETMIFCQNREEPKPQYFLAK